MCKKSGPTGPTGDVAGPAFITKGVPKLTKPEDISVCLTPGFKRCYLSVTRDGDTKLLPISRMVAAELIASDAVYSYQG